jgi:hypothetical protein
MYVHGYSMVVSQDNDELKNIKYQLVRVLYEHTYVRFGCRTNRMWSARMFR